jgi:hypothetical protein
VNEFLYRYVMLPEDMQPLQILGVFLIDFPRNGIKLNENITNTEKEPGKFVLF